MSNLDSNQAQIRAQSLDQSARHHKRQAQRHRDAARKAREELEALRSECARLGIELTFQPGEGMIHGQSSHSRP